MNFAITGGAAAAALVKYIRGSAATLNIPGAESGDRSSGNMHRRTLGFPACVAAFPTDHIDGVDAIIFRLTEGVTDCELLRCAGRRLFSQRWNVLN